MTYVNFKQEFMFFMHIITFFAFSFIDLRTIKPFT